jgi:hypothetical protein
MGSLGIQLDRSSNLGKMNRGHSMLVLLATKHLRIVHQCLNVNSPCSGVLEPAHSIDLTSQMREFGKFW